jgi:hypothetical protein
MLQLSNYTSRHQLGRVVMGVLSFAAIEMLIALAGFNGWMGFAIVSIATTVLLALDPWRESRVRAIIPIARAGDLDTMLAFLASPLADHVQREKASERYMSILVAIQRAQVAQELDAPNLVLQCAALAVTALILMLLVSLCAIPLEAHFWHSSRTMLEIGRRLHPVNGSPAPVTTMAAALAASAMAASLAKLWWSWRKLHRFSMMLANINIDERRLHFIRLIQDPKLMKAIVAFDTFTEFMGEWVTPVLAGLKSKLRPQTTPRARKETSTNSAEIIKLDAIKAMLKAGLEAV